MFWTYKQRFNEATKQVNRDLRKRNNREKFEEFYKIILVHDRIDLTPLFDFYHREIGEQVRVIIAERGYPKLDMVDPRMILMEEDSA